MSNGRKRILFVHSSSEMYGSDRCLLELVKRLSKKRYLPIVVLPTSGLLSRELRRLGFKIYFTDPWVIRKSIFKSCRLIFYLLRIPVSIFRLARIIKMERIELVYSNTSVIVGAPIAAFLLKTPHIVHVRELYTEFPGLWKVYKHFVCLLSKKVICISMAVASQFGKSCSSRLITIYDGIDLARFRGKKVVPKELARWKRKGCIVVANVGRVSSMKNQELFIQVAKKALNQNEQLRFLVVGDIYKGNEAYIDSLRQLVAKLRLKGFLVFTGFKSNIEEFIGHSDIIVLSTRKGEPLGQIVMEGMASGKVVIVPSLGGAKELMKKGYEGMNYKAGSVAALSQLIVSLSYNPKRRNTLGRRALKKARTEFDIKRKVKEVEGVISQALIR
jgi:glycosyltransferase involved in cell wall biosynthesis